MQLLSRQLSEAQAQLADRERQLGSLSRQSREAEAQAQQAKRVEAQVGLAWCLNFYLAG